MLTAIQGVLGPARTGSGVLGVMCSGILQAKFYTVGSLKQAMMGVWQGM